MTGSKSGSMGIKKTCPSFSMYNSSQVINSFCFTGLENPTDYNQDQFLFYKLSLCLITGVVSRDLIGRTIGELSHSRWLTLGARIICFYFKTKKPQPKVKLLTEFVLRGYSVVWYKARQNPRVTDAPKLYFEWMTAIKSFPQEVRDEVIPIFENGLYHCHSENLLLAVLADSDKAVRRRGIAHILKIRNDESFKAKAFAQQKKIKRQKKCAFKQQSLSKATNKL